MDATAAVIAAYVCHLQPQASCEKGRLQARVVLWVEACRVVVLPALAGGLKLLELHRVGDLVLALEELHAETHADMPGDVAMHEPRAWVVRLEGDHHPAAGRKHGDISADRVVEVEVGVSSGCIRSGAVGDWRVAVEEGAVTNAEEEEVVTVKVDRMGEEVVVLNDPPGPFVLGVELHNVGSLHESVILLGDVGEGGLVPLDIHRVTIDSPAEDRLAVDFGCGEVYVENVLVGSEL